MKTLLAVPSCLPGGLDAEMGMHFGHCDIYTLIEIEDGKILNVSTMDNPPHQQGGCLAPVQLLAQAGVRALLAGGAPTVGAGVNAYLAGQLPQFTEEYTCHGGAH